VVIVFIGELFRSLFDIIIFFVWLFAMFAPGSGCIHWDRF